tara:strand:+ start:568 stop:1023 length:456 start_codon:yes stop_codon:yes gene_type:complete
MKILFLTAVLFSIQPTFSCEWRSEVTPKALIQFPALSKKDFSKTEWQGRLIYEGETISPIYLDWITEGLSGYRWTMDPKKERYWESVLLFKGEYPVRGRSNNSVSDERRVILVDLGRHLWYSDKRDQIESSEIYSAINDFWHVSNKCRMPF